MVRGGMQLPFLLRFSLTGIAQVPPALAVPIPLCEGHSGCRWLRPRTVLQTLAPGITLCSSHGHFLRPLLSSSFRLCCSGAAVQWGRAGEGRRKKWGAALQKKRKKSEKAVIWGLGMLVVSPLPLPDPPFQTRMKRLLRNSPGLALSASV